MTMRNRRAARGWSGDGMVLKGTRKISIVFDDATFAEISAAADGRRVSFSTVVRELVDASLKRDEQRAA